MSVHTHMVVHAHVLVHAHMAVLAHMDVKLRLFHFVAMGGRLGFLTTLKPH